MRQKKRLACCFFPTTIAMVDDKLSFLQSMQSMLWKNRYTSMIEDNPFHFVDFFNQDYKPQLILQSCVQWLEEDNYNHRTLDIDISPLSKLMQHPKRFQEIAVLLVDYSMPLMTGLEMIEKLQPTPIKKVLLPGEADEKIAVRAFNQGLIDAYIRKDDPSFKTVILSTIAQLQLNYFQDISELVITSITKESERPSCLDDPIFIDFINQLIHQHGFVEYYLLDEFGSCVFLDFKGHSSLFIVKDEESMDQLYEMAQAYADEGESVSTKVLEGLRTKKSMLYVPSSNVEAEATPAFWDDYLFKTLKLKGRQNYYYVLIIDASHLVDIKGTQILSYEKFLACGNN
jgi:CheY-like chemotaxis protein